MIKYEFDDQELRYKPLPNYDWLVYPCCILVGVVFGILLAYAYYNT